jgi:predicted Zn-dependent protease
MNKKNLTITASNKILELGHYYPEVLIQLIDLFLEKKDWEKAHNIAEEAFAAFPENRDLSLRVAGCCLILERTEEGMFLLNPKKLSVEEKVSFQTLFPKLKNLVSHS